MYFRPEASVVTLTSKDQNTLRRWRDTRWKRWRSRSPGKQGDDRGRGRAATRPRAPFCAKAARWEKVGPVMPAASWDGARRLNPGSATPAHSATTMRQMQQSGLSQWASATVLPLGKGAILASGNSTWCWKLSWQLSLLPRRHHPHPPPPFFASLPRSSIRLNLLRL